MAGNAIAAPAGGSPYFGRWTVSDDKPVFTAKGREYKTIDIAPCGKDFCGVSVGDKAQCGAVLFRFLARHQDGSTALQGHAKWGAAIKNVVIETWESPDDKGIPKMQLRLGDGYDLGDRSGNMPKFSAEYRRLGQAGCRAR